MAGMDLEIIIHKMNVNASFNPVKQNRRRFAPEKNQAMNEKVDKLETNGIIREVCYPKWLANIVVVKKKNGKNGVCIDFIDLNKPSPKGSFLLLMIDRLVDATVRHKMMNFMDAFLGYNQILMHPSD